MNLIDFLGDFLYNLDENIFRGGKMAVKKCPSCGKEMQENSSGCIHCGFEMANLERDGKIKIVVQEPNALPLGSPMLSIFNEHTGALITEVRFGDIFYLTITEPTTISVRKTAWKTGKVTLRAKQNATYKIILKTGFLSSKIIIKDITESPIQVADDLTDTTEPKDIKANQEKEEQK